MTDAVIDEIDGRMIRIGDHWLADFASCNYLGFDLDREIIDAIPAYLDRWGTHPSWSRLLGSPVLYEQIEERLTALLGAADVLVLPTITLIHFSVIPLLAAERHACSSTGARTRPSTRAQSSRRSAARRCKRFEHDDARRARAAAAQRHRVRAADLHRRRQQHDRQRARPRRVSRRSRASTTRSCTSTTRTASA